MIMQRLRRAVLSYVQEIRGFNRNVRLLLIASVLSSLTLGIFTVEFNLYILSLGIKVDVLGVILSAGPFAHALGAIPIGFLSEVIGYKKTFLIVYLLAGLSQLVRVATPNVGLISAAAFIEGLVISGNFVVLLPFLAANVGDSGRTHVFSVNSLLSSLAMALGSLFAGYVPNLIQFISPDITTQYRYTLYIAGALTLLAVAPVLMIKDHTLPQTSEREEKKRISLYPYLWGIDRFTAQAAIVELFIGLTVGLLNPFMNIYFLYHLGTSREFFSGVEALVFIPTIIATALGPTLAARLGIARTMTMARYLIPVTTVVMALTTIPLAGASTYWLYKALFAVAQPLWFAYAMDAATPKAKVAVSAWLEITFWIGIGLAARLTGGSFAQSNYTLPFYLSAAAALVTAVLIQVFVGSRSVLHRRRGEGVS